MKLICMVLKMAIILGVNEIEIYRDSLLIINQSTNDWDVNDEKLKDVCDVLVRSNKEIYEVSIYKYREKSESYGRFLRQ